MLEIALTEVGYREGAGNVTKYAAELDKLPGFYNGPKNGYAWCDVFVDWCFYKAYGRTLAQLLLCQPDDSAGAGCTYSARYYQQKGRWRTSPEVGAQIFFGSAAESTHTGLVYAVDATTVYTVEGNTSGGVYKRQYARGAGNIYGYGMPDYGLVDAVAADNAPGSDDGENDEVVYATPSTAPITAAKAAFVAPRTLQAWLVDNGYDIGDDGIDGDIGKNTIAGLEAALKDMR